MLMKNRRLRGAVYEDCREVTIDTSVVVISGAFLVGLGIVAL